MLSAAGEAQPRRRAGFQAQGKSFFFEKKSQKNFFSVNRVGAA
jgi:hypothetical protein